MIEVLPFFIILFVGVFFSEIFSRLHLPWVIALVVGGIFVGPGGFDLFTPSPAIELLGQIGLIFLMFMAGLETKLSSFKNAGRQTIPTALLNGGIPFVVGLVVVLLFGFELNTALTVAIIFVSSSIAVVIPALQSNNFLDSKVGHNIVMVTIIEDIASLLLFSILLQRADPTTSLPLPVFYLFIAISLIVLRFIIPKIRFFFSYTKDQEVRDVFQQEIRSIFVILLGTVLIFELLGLHPIIAGFFAGFVLSGSVNSRILKDRLQAIGYGVFIPIFFVLVGIQTDVSVFFSLSGVLLLVIVVTLASMISKFLSGWLSAKLQGYSKQEAFLLGVSTIPQLSTSLAVVFSGVELGLINNEIASAIVVLSIVTTFVGPLLIKWLSGKVYVTQDGRMIKSEL